MHIDVWHYINTHTHTHTHSHTHRHTHSHIYRHTDTQTQTHNTLQLTSDGMPSFEPKQKTVKTQEINTSTVFI